MDAFGSTRDDVVQVPILTLNRSDPSPLYAQVAEQIEAMIISGTLAPGRRLPAEIDLATDLGVSRATVRRAIQRLASRGFLLRRHGVGTQIVTHYRRRSRPLTSLHDELARENRMPRTKVLELLSVPADGMVAQTFGVAVGTPVLSVTRLRTADAIPVAIMHNILPAHVRDLTAMDLEHHGLYEILRARHLRMRVAEQTITAVSANASQTDALEVAVGAPLLQMDTITYTDEGDCIDIGQHFYRPDQYTFKMTNHQQ